jgi:hypothetical protein
VIIAADPNRAEADLQAGKLSCVYVTWNLSRPITLSRADLLFLQADLASDQVSPALAPIAA